MSEDIKNGIQLCPDGKYRWAYEVNMYRNPTIFYVIANMFLISLCYSRSSISAWTRRFYHPY